MGAKSSRQDVSNFDTVFTTEEPLDSVVEGSQLSQTVQAQFAGTCCYCYPVQIPAHLPKGFSYDGTNMPVSPT